MLQYLEININLPQTDSDSLDRLSESKIIIEANFIEEDEDSYDLENWNKFENYQKIRLYF